MTGSRGHGRGARIDLVDVACKTGAMNEPSSGPQPVRPHPVWGNVVVIVVLAAITAGAIGLVFSATAPGAFAWVAGVGTALLVIVFAAGFWLAFPPVTVDLEAGTIRWKGRSHELAQITRAEVFTRGVYTILRLTAGDGRSVALIVAGFPVRPINAESKLLLARAVERSGIEGETDDARGRSGWSIGSVKNNTWETVPFALSRADTVFVLLGAPSVDRLANAPGTVVGFGDPAAQPMPERLAVLASGPSTGWKIVGSALMLFGAGLAALFALLAAASAYNQDPWSPIWIILFLASTGLFLLGLGRFRGSR
jgi:hypothetical protein